MSQLPWVKWFCSDWLSDPCLSRCCPATRGIWKDAVDAMICSSAATLSGTLAALARVCRCSELEMQQALLELQLTGTANVSKVEGPESDSKTIANDVHVLECRRLTRANEISQKRREIGKNGIAKRWQSDSKRLANLIGNEAGEGQEIDSKAIAKAVCASASASAYASASQERESEGEGTGGESVHARELERLTDQPELRELTLEQWMQCKRFHPTVEITPAVMDEIRGAALLRRDLTDPGRFVRACLSRLEVAEKKEGPRKKRWFKPEEMT